LVKTLHPLADIAARISGTSGELICLTRAGDALPDENGTPQSTSADVAATSIDPVAATVDALADPLEFPPLAAGLVPGDCVAIAVAEAVPCVASIVRGVVESLDRAGIDREAVSIVASTPAAAQVCREEFASDVANPPRSVLHDPDDNDNLCLVGLTKRGRPLLVNRAIFDADVVLPIGCARPHGRGVFENVYPRFSDADTIRRHRIPGNQESAKERNARIRETNEAGWLIGVPMAIEVVPGANNTVTRVLAGEPRAAANLGDKLSNERWSFQSPQRVSLVIATITGGPQSQTWENVGRALAPAYQLVEEGGAIAICSNLNEPVGKSLGRLIGSTNFAAAQRKISHDHSEDSEAAWQIARALEHGPVYFLSQLDSQTVEDLGLAPVESIDELVRLAGHHESVLIVADAQHVAVTVAGESDER